MKTLNLFLLFFFLFSINTLASDRLMSMIGSDEDEFIMEFLDKAGTPSSSAEVTSKEKVVERLGFSMPKASGDGFIITDVDTNSPASKAGIMAGDLVIGYNGNKLRKGKLYKSIQKIAKLQDKKKLIVFSIKRGDEIIKIKVKAGSYLRPRIKKKILTYRITWSKNYTHSTAVNGGFRESNRTSVKECVYNFHFKKKGLYGTYKFIDWSTSNCG
jgi:predicted metalloprotease with PDZ domain